MKETNTRQRNDLSEVIFLTKSASMCSVYNEKCSLEATKVRWSKIQNKYNLTNTQGLYRIPQCSKIHWGGDVIW